MAEDKSNKVWIAFPSKGFPNSGFITETSVTFTDKRGEHPLLRVGLPKGTVVNGVDLGGASFVSRYATEIKSAIPQMAVSFLPGQEVNLSVPDRDNEGRYIKGSYSPYSVTAEELRDAVKAAFAESRKQYRESKERAAERSVEAAQEQGAQERLESVEELAQDSPAPIAEDRAV